MQSACYWYSSTESKIYSKARERLKDSKEDPTEDQIKATEERLRALYYRESIPVNESDVNGNYPTREEYQRNLDQIKEKLKGQKI